MKKLGTKGLKVLKTCHLIFVMIWVVGVMAMALISLIKPQTGDEMYMILYISRFVDDLLVIPGAILTVITAVIYGAFTNWGFFKHKWIIVKWIVSVLVIIVGTFYFSPILDNCLLIADKMRNAALNNSEVLDAMHITTLGAFMQSALLVVLVIISVFKPWKTKKNK